MTAPTRPALDYDRATIDSAVGKLSCELVDIDSESMRGWACYGWLILQAEASRVCAANVKEAWVFAKRVMREF